jgi:Protein of unknown function (DUF2891)
VTTRLDDGNADRLLATALANVQRDFPVHWTHFVASDEELRPQRSRHPVFAGSYDWHSCVHQTWLAVRLLRLRPGLPATAEATAVLDRLLTSSNVAGEVEFFAGAEGKHWERPYGWAWLFVLDAELRGWSGGAAWAAALRPLTDVLRQRWLDWVVPARLPVRTGTHSNTAFALTLALDAARAVGDEEFAGACAAAARRWYAADAGYGGFEPDAADFLSPALTEADLMRRVLPTPEFTAWWESYLPDLDAPRWAALRSPTDVPEPGDPYGGHLAGLALSRAWGWSAIAAALPAGHRWTELASTAAESHRAAGWQHVFGHGYAAEHWLGTFAAYLELGALTP